MDKERTGQMEDLVEKGIITQKECDAEKLRLEKADRERKERDAKKKEAVSV